MMHHIVAWKFKEQAEGSSKAENLIKAKFLLDSLPGKIAQIGKMEVGIDVSRGTQSYDLVLNSQFRDQADLTFYQQHAAHVAVVEFLRKVQETKVVIDYEV